MSKEHLFDDLAKMAGGAASALGGFGTQIKDEIKTRVDEMAERLDLVPREDFERVEAMLKESRRQQDELIKRIEALEAKTKETGKK